MYKNVNDNYVIHSNGDMYRLDINLKLKHYDKDGSPVYTYLDNGKTKTKRVKLLVAEAFIENPMDFKFVVNINKDKYDNDVSNLKWTHSIDDLFHMNDKERECTECREIKPISKFSKRNNRSIGIQSKCINCTSISNKKRRLKDPDKYRDKYYKTSYNSSLDEYNNLLNSQGGGCAICKTNSNKMCMDHCHDTMKIRGVLCDRCNRGIGLLRDDVDVLLSAYKYLLKYK
jgi:hypothetical protein